MKTINKTLILLLLIASIGTAAATTPAITLTPTHGVNGTQVSIQFNNGFNNKEINIIFGNQEVVICNDKNNCNFNVPNVASGTYIVNASQKSGSNYNNASATFIVDKRLATLQLNITNKTYDGTPDVATVTTTPSGLTGVTITYNNSIIAPTEVGSYIVNASLSNAYYSATATNGTMIISQATPTITWATPSAIIYDTALSGAQLDATASFNGNTVAGTFIYAPDIGTILSVGTQTLSTTFTPTDNKNYTNASNSVTINVKQATPTITWSNPANISYGTALSSIQLNAAASVAGTKLYTPSNGTVL